MCREADMMDTTVVRLAGNQANLVQDVFSLRRHRHTATSYMFRVAVQQCSIMVTLHADPGQHRYHLHAPQICLGNLTAFANGWRSSSGWQLMLHMMHLTPDLMIMARHISGVSTGITYSALRSELQRTA